MAHIELATGPRAGERIEIVGEVTLGRETADVVIDDEEMSRRHAVIRADGGTVTIEDLGSLNGTWVDGRRIEGRTPLADGSEVKLGATVCRVELPGAQATRLTPAHVGGADNDGSDLTVVRPVPGTTTVSAHAAAPAAEPAPAPAVAATGRADEAPRPGAPALAPFTGDLRNARRRRRGVATRSIPAAAFVSAIVVADAVALIVYFRGR